VIVAIILDELRIEVKC